MEGIERFHAAQDASSGGYEAALREMEAGRKTSHWIWYIFPQLDGLARSSTARYYGIGGLAEARDYLQDPVLAGRLLEVAEAALRHLEPPRPARIEDLMGSHIDAVKLVSSMTLFAGVAASLGEASEQATRITEIAGRILAAASAQGYRECSYTRSQLQSGSG